MTPKKVKPILASVANSNAGISNHPKSMVEKTSHKLTRWVGTPQSIILHSFFFAGIFIFTLFGVALDKIMLILTTAVSLEAIYLSLFIQMTVNRNTESLEDVEEDLEDIQEDVKELGEEVDELSDDIDDIQEEDKKEDEEEKKAVVALQNIEEDMDKLLGDIEALKKNIQESSTMKKYLNG